ncbi:MAG: acyl--CoA ligase [Desulfobacteraceae bacterium]|nr:acyl--CoA ligase [Desulfobacteraceae bacterium]MCF8096015.1 acyl--CoA ligase [Desulfobacteraceae bacterium]
MIHHFLENAAANTPGKTAVIYEAERATYAHINTMADNLAVSLQTNGIQKSDRVALIMENSIDYIISYYGILKAGAVAAPLNPGLKPDGLQYQVDDLEPAVIIATFKSERLLKAISLNEQTLKLLVIKNPKQKWEGMPFRVLDFGECISDQASTPEHAARNPDDLASIIYTSGSTGKPKGVMLSHKNIVSNTRSICKSLDLGPDDIQMVVLPFFYVMGKSLLNTHFAVGGTVVINNRFIYPADVVKQMAEENVTGFSGVPSTYAYLLHRSPLAKYRERLPSLRYCSQAGGHMAAQLKRDLRAALPEHTRIVIMYGATEAAARLSCLEPQRFEQKMGSIGRAIDDVELRVLDETGQFSRNGTQGELVACGPNIMMGYWKDSAATRRAIDKNGYYHTGDIGYQDDQGYFYITGRKDNILKVSGHKVNPKDIEEVLMQSQQLLETAVIGVPDDLSGHRLAALCVPIDKGLSEADLQKYCHQNLPKYQVPSEFAFFKALPKGDTGKVDTQKCVAAYEQLKTKN